MPEVNGGDRPGYIEGWGTWDGHATGTGWLFPDVFGVQFSRAPAAGVAADPLILRGGLRAASTPVTHVPRSWMAQQRVYTVDVGTPQAGFDPASLVDGRARTVPATHARPGWVQSRAAATVPDVAAVPVPGPVPVPVWRRDPAPPAPVRAPVVGLLDQSLLEDPLIGAATAGLRAVVAASHGPRVWQAQQLVRAATTPGLLDQALLEAPLLRPLTAAPAARPAPAAPQPARPVVPDETTALDPTVLVRANLTPVTHRRDPAGPQRATLPDPGLLASALLEDPLLGGATTGLRAAVPVTHADRRETVPPRLALVDQSTGAVYDPTLAPAPRSTTPHMRLPWARPAAQAADQSTTAVDYDPTLTPPARTVTAYLRAIWVQARQSLADQSTPAASYDPTLAPAARSIAGLLRDYWTRPVAARADQSTAAADLDPTATGERSARLTPATHARPSWARTTTPGADQSTPADVPRAVDRWHLPATHARPAWARPSLTVADQSTPTEDIPRGLDRWHTPATHSRPGWARTPGMVADQSTTGDVPAGQIRWHQPATHSRDKTTVQRAYLSDPGLLATALLEQPLLGDTQPGVRRAWVRGAPLPPRFPGSPAPAPGPDADPLTLTGQTLLKTLTPATHGPRPVLRWQRTPLVDVGVTFGPPGRGRVTVTGTRSTVTVDGSNDQVTAGASRTTITTGGAASTVTRDTGRSAVEVDP